jgi:hypothetical protein
VKNCSSCKKKINENKEYWIIREHYRFDSFLNETNYYCKRCYYWKGYFITEEMVIWTLFVVLVVFLLFAIVKSNL